MIPKIIVLTTIIIGGCASRQPHLNQYKWATYGPGDSAAGDLTHAEMPGARVVIPKQPLAGPQYMRAFDKPSIDCVEIGHGFGTEIKDYACPADPPQVKSTTIGGCDETLWQHTYKPQRLVIHDRCVTVTGTIVDATHGKRKDGVRKEADGDTHGWLRLDPGQEQYLNAGNMSDEEGNLVYEVVCYFPVKQEDAKAACQGYKSPIKLVKVGSRVRITGSWVMDDNHARWFEIHPVSNIDIISNVPERKKNE